MSSCKGQMDTCGVCKWQKKRGKTTESASKAINMELWIILHLFYISSAQTKDNGCVVTVKVCTKHLNAQQSQYCKLIRYAKSNMIQNMNVWSRECVVIANGFLPISGWLPIVSSVAANKWYYTRLPTRSLCAGGNAVSLYIFISVLDIVACL